MKSTYPHRNPLFDDAHLLSMFGLFEEKPRTQFMESYGFQISEGKANTMLNGY